MRKTIKIDNKEMNVEFSGYYDSSYGELLFTQVMCDVFMPGNEVVPIAVEKRLIQRVIDGFKKRSALYDEVRKEVVKGKACYVITPRMRYDLGWLGGKKKAILSKDNPPVFVQEDAVAAAEMDSVKPEPKKRPGESDNRRRYLTGQGFRFQEEANHWTFGSIRFPDAMIDKPATDEEFYGGIARLMEADAAQRGRQRKPK